eukprot:4218634-Amphidinium_carterae.1
MDDVAANCVTVKEVIGLAVLGDDVPELIGADVVEDVGDVYVDASVVEQAMLEDDVPELINADVVED